jgi:hypothetical protein
VQRWSRFIRNWYFRCRETFRFVNLSLIRFLIYSLSAGRINTRHGLIGQLAPTPNWLPQFPRTVMQNSHKIGLVAMPGGIFGGDFPGGNSHLNTSW